MASAGNETSGEAASGARRGDEPSIDRPSNLWAVRNNTYYDGSDGDDDTYDNGSDGDDDTYDDGSDGDDDTYDDGSDGDDDTYDNGSGDYGDVYEYSSGGDDDMDDYGSGGDGANYGGADGDDPTFEEGADSGRVADWSIKHNSFYAVEQFGVLFSQMPRKLRTYTGHQLTTMLLNCNWNGRSCDER